MKKIILLTVSILIVSAVFARAGNPIPSFNVPVSNKAYFQEDPTLPSNYVPTDEKRDMNVSNDTPGGHGPVGNGLGAIQVVIYRLDQSIVLGPFTISAGQTLTIPIDGERWGVAAQTSDPTYMSVWSSKTQL
jgi:hypothetical protein